MTLSHTSAGRQATPGADIGFIGVGGENMNSSRAEICGALTGRKDTLTPLGDWRNL
jgi:hypothetical protein